MGSLDKQVAIVTGAGHPDGIGRGIADKLISQGATVIITDLQNHQSELDKAAEIYLSEGASVSTAIMDVTDNNQIKNCFSKIISDFGQIDILVNNAGVGVGSADFLEMSEKDWALSLAVNVLGVSNCCKAAIPVMLKQNKGTIINVSSLAGLGAIEAIPVCYTASKYAVIGITKQLAVNYAGNNIRVNAVCPGTIKTQMHDIAMSLASEAHGVSLKEAENIEKSRIPIERFGTPHDVGNAVAYLSSEAASYLTGVCIPVAGGLSPGL